MNFFKLFAHGVEFDADAYFSTDPIGFHRVWRVGEQHYKTNGVEKLLGDGEQLTVFDQDQIATAFLEKHEAELFTVGRLPGVDTFILGLQYRTEFGPDLRGICLSFSARLTYFVLRTGVSPSFYVDLVPNDEWEDT